MIDWIKTAQGVAGDRGRDLRDYGRLVEPRPAAPRVLPSWLRSHAQIEALEQFNLQSGDCSVKAKAASRPPRR